MNNSKTEGFFGGRFSFKFSFFKEKRVKFKENSELNSLI
jgi:hypothetical protein